MLKIAQFLIKLTLLLSAFVSYAHADEKAYSLIEVYQQALENDPTLASALSANQAAQEAIEQAKALYRLRLL